MCRPPDKISKLTGKQLIEDNDTRWNSFFMAIGRALNVRERIVEFCFMHQAVGADRRLEDDTLSNLGANGINWSEFTPYWKTSTPPPWSTRATEKHSSTTGSLPCMFSLMRSTRSTNFLKGNVAMKISPGAVKLHGQSARNTTPAPTSLH